MLLNISKKKKKRSCSTFLNRVRQHLQKVTLFDRTVLKHFQLSDLFRVFSLATVCFGYLCVTTVTWF